MPAPKPRFKEAGPVYERLQELIGKRLRSWRERRLFERAMRPICDLDHPRERQQQNARLTGDTAPNEKIPAACRDLHHVAGCRLERRTRLELATLSLGS
jgi:hypothetical protein